MSLDFEKLGRNVVSKYLRDVEVLHPTGSKTKLLSFRGLITIGDIDWPIEVRLPRGFPTALPKVFVPKDRAGKFLHVGATGLLCVLQTEGASGDHRRPEEIIEEILKQTIITLDRLVSKASHEAVLKELEAYAIASGAASTVSAYFEPRDSVLMLRGALKDTYISLSQDDAEVDAFFGGPRPRIQHRQAIYVPLTRGASEALTLPLPFTHSADQVRQFIFTHCADEAGLRRVLTKSPKGEVLVVLGFPRGATRALVGVKLSNRQNDARHPLALHCSDNAFEVFSIQRSDRAALAPRGGAETQLGSKRIVLIGCGALGGHIALLLAKAGVGHFLLIDDDALRRENLFRHVLGTKYLGKRKSVALAEELRSAVPFCAVDAKVGRGDEMLRQNPSAFENYDLVVLATGDTSVDLFISDGLRAVRRPLVASWLEPLGLGGHVLALGDGDGCLRCLFEETSAGLVNRASFAQPGQPFAVTDSGCGGAHTPFSNFDAARTGELAARRIVSLLKSPAEPSWLESWKGDGMAFVQAGYRTSSRFATDALLVSPLPNEPCLCCGGKVS